MERATRDVTVFISWSGEASQELALALRDWLPQVMQAIKPWMSNIDIPPGSRWQSDIASQLEGTDFGISCITNDNTLSPWINFESGALSKAVSKSRVVPLLLNMRPSDIPHESPLIQFQAVSCEKSGIEKILSEINMVGPNVADSDKLILPDEILKKSFEKWWNDLDQKIEEIISKDRTHLSKDKPKTSQENMISEILEGVRSLLRQISEYPIEIPEGLLGMRMAKDSEHIEILNRIMKEYPEDIGKTVGEFRVIDLWGGGKKFFYDVHETQGVIRRSFG